MQYQWLKKTECENLIVIFSGWGFGSEIFDHLVHSHESQNYDVLFVNDYRELVIDLPDLQNYRARYLLAWSFGVASFAAWHQKQLIKSNSLELNFDLAVAISGTMHAVDRFLGIPEKVMQKTIDTLSAQSFQLFASRCFDKDQVPENLAINVEQRKSELQNILVRTDVTTFNAWDIVWIASEDKIFPTKNQLRAWQQYNDKLKGKPALIKHSDAPHAPFHLWSGWKDILQI